MIIFLLVSTVLNFCPQMKMNNDDDDMTEPNRIN